MTYEAKAPSHPTEPLQLPIRVVVVAGAPVDCEAIVSRLSIEDDLHAVALAGTYATVAGSLATFAPHVVIVDPEATGAQDAGLVDELRGLPGSPNLVLLVTEREVALTARYVKAGAAAAVLKTASSNELVSAVRWTARGAGWISPPLLRRVLEELHGAQNGAGNERLSRLTDREREVLQLMVDGLGRRQMAERLYLSIDTVRTHMRTVMEKLGVHSATAAVSVALAAGLRPSR